MPARILWKVLTRSYAASAVAAVAMMLPLLPVACDDNSSSSNTPSNNGGSSGACAVSCDDGFTCTIDTCSGSSCKHSIGPNMGSTACPSSQYCTVEKGCVKAPACATNTDCVEAWKGDACKANPRCDSASSVCIFDILDKDGDKYAPQVCGGDDCNDGSASIHPGATEICNGTDDDCDGTVDKEVSAETPLCSITETCASGKCACKQANFCSSTCVDLTSNAMNCGACNVVCAGSKLCVQGACSDCDPLTCGEVLWRGSESLPPTAIVLDGDTLYWGAGADYAPGSGAIFAANKDGTDTRLLTDGFNAVTCLAPGASGLYVTVQATYSTPPTFASDGYLGWIPQSGGTIKKVRDGLTTQPIMVNGTLFFGDSYDLIALASPNESGVVFYLNLYSSPRLTSDGERIYWSDFEASGGTSCKFYSQLINGTVVDQIFSSTTVDNCGFRFAVDETTLYWLDEAGQRLRAMPKIGGTATTLDKFDRVPRDLAIDEATAFWSVPGDDKFCNGWIGAIPKAGGSRRVVAASLCFPKSIAIDDGYIYWTNGGDATVRRIAK